MRLLIFQFFFGCNVLDYQHFLLQVNCFIIAYKQPIQVLSVIIGHHVKHAEIVTVVIWLFSFLPVKGGL